MRKFPVQRREPTLLGNVQRAGIAFVLVIARRTVANGAESLNRMPPSFFCTPKSVQIAFKSTGDGESFIFSYSSRQHRNTGRVVPDPECIN